MLKKRIIITLTFFEGILFRTKKFKPDYRYTKNFLDLWSIDELILIDVSSVKFQKNFLEIINFFSKNCFVPITVGGGIKTLQQADIFFKNGADKILLGSHSIENPELINSISKKYGNQSIVQSLDFKKIKNDKYIIMKNSGINHTEIKPEKWGKTALECGAGEILLNSIDNDGGLLGYDYKFIENISKKLECPILALGGAGNWEHIYQLFATSNVSAACTQNIYHFTQESINSAKKYLINKDIKIRV